MIKGRNYTTRYSQAFKQKVLHEIENGQLTQSEAARKYGICSPSLVNYWVKKSNNPCLLRKVVRIEMPNEIQSKDIIKQLEAEKKQLESALAQSHLKNELLETMIHIAEREYCIDIKKILVCDSEKIQRAKGENRLSKDNRSFGV
jgi:transposase